MNMGTGAGGHVCSEILGPIGENRPVKKIFWIADARAIDSSGIMRGLPNLHQIQANCGAFCFFAGVKQWKFLQLLRADPGS
jgi:hypothetical protein